MAPVTPAAWMQAGSYSARLDRQVLSAMWWPDVELGPMAARSGVKPSPQWSGMQVTQRQTPDRWVSVWGGSCVIQASDPYGGCYVGQNDALYDIPVPAAHASLPRRDVVYAQVLDAVDDVGSSNEFIISVLEGTPASAPVAPSLPSQSIALAEVLVQPGSTVVTNSDITDRRVWTVPLGGVLPVRSDDEVPMYPFAGMKIYRTGQRLEQVWDGTAWRTTMDAGYGYPAGTLGLGRFDASPAHTVTSTAGVSLRYGNGSQVARVNFTMPSGVPSTRAIRFTISGHVQLADGAQVWATPYLDSASLFAERRAPIIGNGFAYGWSQIWVYPATDVAAGAHYMEVRAKVANSSAAAAFHSYEMHVELI